jgi:hypothetical protein
MRFYRFALRDSDSQIEEIGAMALPDDTEAVSFGKGIVQDLARAPLPQPGLALAVINDDRIVGVIHVE